MATGQDLRIDDTLITIDNATLTIDTSYTAARIKIRVGGGPRIKAA